jgi:hypothetical protein
MRIATREMSATFVETRRLLHRSDEELLDQYVATGAQEAFTELVYRYERELYGRSLSFHLHHC